MRSLQELKGRRKKKRKERVGRGGEGRGVVARERVSEGEQVGGYGS